VKKKTTEPAAPELTPGLRRFLYVTACLTGGAIMVVEILGAKMLAPYLGTSHFVWTAQIAVTLVALAAGYYAGGRLVDASPRLSHLYLCLLAAGLYLSLTILLVRPVAFACIRLSLPVGSLLASAFLFFIPLGLMAMVGPFLIRILTASVNYVGGNVGRLTALSTLGSFAGTMLVSYILIRFLPNSISMYLTAALLLALPLLYFVVWRKSAFPPTGAIALVGLVVGLMGVRQDLRGDFRTMEELARHNSPFGMLQVLQAKNGTRRLYLNDYLVQNTYDILAKKSTSMFTFMLHDLAVAYTPRIESALCIGMGVGIVPMDFVRAGVQVDVVEINPEVVPIAREFFDCEPETFHLVIGDGRSFLNDCDRQYDAVVLDAFLGDSSPSHLMTREAFASIARVLKPDGVLVMNCFGDFAPGKDFFVASLYKTLSAVFPGVRIHNAYNGGNVFFVAGPRSSLDIVRPPTFEHLYPAVASAVQSAFARRVETNPDHGIVLTDDYNPVEIYDAANREEVRRSLAGNIHDYF